MGAWGTAIFSDDQASDARDAFRELIAAGRSPQEASDEVVADLELVDPAEDADECSAWLGLAVTQWKLGRVVDAVRDTALRAIEVELADSPFEGADRRRRAAVLAKTREQLLSAPPAPKRIRAERFAQSPFSPGDVLRYTTASGRQVALWAMFEDRHQRAAGEEVSTCFRLQAFGDPELPEVAEIVRRPPVVTDGGHRAIEQFSLWLPQDAVGPAWEVIGHVPFGDPGNARSGPFTVLTVRARRPPTLDQVLEKWFDDERRAAPVTRALEPYVDLLPQLATAERARSAPLASPADALDVAGELAVELDEGRDAHVTTVLAIVERALAGDDPFDRRVAIDLLDGLVNAATHPDVRYVRADLEPLLGPASRAIVLRLDDAWATSERGDERPLDFLLDDDRESAGDEWSATVLPVRLRERHARVRTCLADGEPRPASKIA